METLELSLKMKFQHLSKVMPTYSELSVLCYFVQFLLIYCQIHKNTISEYQNELIFRLTVIYCT